jgi:hypothetical protein
VTTVLCFLLTVLALGVPLGLLAAILIAREIDRAEYEEPFI